MGLERMGRDRSDLSKIYKMCLKLESCTPSIIVILEMDVRRIAIKTIKRVCNFKERIRENREKLLLKACYEKKTYRKRITKGNIIRKKAIEGVRYKKQ